MMYIVHISICLAVLFTADCQPMLVFFPCSQSAPDMPFGFVDVQHYSGLGGEGWVDVFQTIGDILMYRRLGNSKPSGCLAHGSVVVDNVIRNSNGRSSIYSFMVFHPENVFTIILQAVVFYALGR